VKAARVTNALAPIVVDTSQSSWPIASADGIICINMADISPWDATVGLIGGAAAILPPGSPFYLYGPYKRKGFNGGPEQRSVRPGPSRSQPDLGLRDLEAVVTIAQSLGFSVPTVTEMPANKRDEIGLNRIRIPESGLF
jgi:hypothetical protein